MSMLALVWHDSTQRIDLTQCLDDKIGWLENAVTISLFTDALASRDDELSDGSSDRRGYWGDTELSNNESLGSKLWLLKREKITQSVINKARDYCDIALAWLVREQHLTAITVTAQREGHDRITFTIRCQLPKGDWISLLRSHRHAV